MPIPKLDESAPWKIWRCGKCGRPVGRQDKYCTECGALDWSTVPDALDWMKKTRLRQPGTRR